MTSICQELRTEMAESVMKNALSPILGLPTDILSIIFEICMRTTKNKDADVMSMKTVQWVLSQTCRSWRESVLGNPSLWRVILIGTDHYRGVKDPLSMLGTWLSRSQSLPISCCIQLFWMQANQDHREVEAGIVDLIIGDSCRWLHVILDLDARPDLYHKVGAIQNPLPLLRFLQIRAHHAGSDIDYSEPYGRLFQSSAFSSAPSLSIAHLEVSSSLLPISLPWHQLQRCRLYDTALLFKEVSNLQNLSHLTLSLRHTDIVFLPLSLARLRRLEISFSTVYVVVQFLDASFLPSLQDLQVVSQFRLGTENLLRSIRSLQDRSSCQLKRMFLRIHPIPIRTNLRTSFGSPEIMKSFDTLKELHICFRDGISPARPQPTDYLPFPSQELLMILHDRNLFPRLKALYIVALHYPYPGSDTFFDGLANVITSRRNHNQYGVRLERLSIDTLRSYDIVTSKPKIPISVKGIQRIIELQSEGLMLVQPIVDGWLCPVHERTTHWDAE
ncbi:hypothetical protein L218DRAFT_987071 [Marasmius fiardii PR-910]|nr:hypothetical protein L218DRAFT_987071 [Marasmius fiardii PR-910]